MAEDVFTPPLSNLSEASERILTSINSALASLHLDELDESWVRDIWDAQFTECQELDPEYEAYLRQQHVDICKTLDKTTDYAQKWLKLSDQHSRNEASGSLLVMDHSGLSVSGVGANAEFWTTLIKEGIKYKSLIALLYYYLDRGQKLQSASLERDVCLRSASLYFVLLGIPGSGAFKIFHPVLYNKALDTFKLALKLHLVRLSPKKATKRGRKKASQSSQPRKRHASRTSSTCSGMSQMSELDWNDSDEEDGQLTPGEVTDLTSGLNKVLFHFLTLLDHCSLKRSQESLELSVQELVELTHLETGFANLDFGHHLRRSDLSALAYNAYIGLQKLCAPLHGQVEHITAMVFRYLLPGILMTHRGASEIAPRGLAIIREHAMHFVKHLMATVGDASFGSVEILVQHLAMKVPDRAEFRQKASSAIVDLLIGLPGHVFTRIVRWFFCLAHNDKSAHRQFAIEVMGRLLAENERKKPPPATVADHDYGFGGVPETITEVPENDNLDNPVAAAAAAETNDADENRNGRSSSVNVDLYASHKFLFGVIFSRCNDISATVRAKALQTLADVTATAENNEMVANIIRNLFEQPDHQSNSSSKGTVDFVELLQDPNVDLSSVKPLPSSQSFIDFLRKRALDESVYVRKNALQVLENILKFCSSTGQLELEALELVKILSEHCRDPSVMVRKQMVTSLTELVKTYPESDPVINQWVEGVFPLILDVEQKAAEKVHECVWEVVFGNLVHFSDTVYNRHFLPWRVLHATERQQMTRYLSRACGQWAKAGQLKPTLLKLLKSHIHTENGNAAWLLLALVSGHVPLQDPQYVMDYFNTSIHTPEGVGLYTLLQVLRVLLASVAQLPKDQKTILQKDLVTLVQRFSIPPELISTAVDIATIISWLESGGAPSKSPTKKDSSNVNLKVYHANLDGWAVEIIEKIDSELSRKILQPSSEDVEDTRMMRQVFTLGELAQICPHRINKRQFLLMQSIIFQQGTKHRKRKEKEIETIPSSQTQTTEPLQCAFTPTTRLQALSVITLAKMCLQNEDMAKRVVPAFGRLLDTTHDAALKNNIMYALSDMCVRYASLVDPLLPQMTACLKDSSLTVRRTTLTTLIHLLQEDYLKMTPGFFFRILQTLGDDSEEVRHLTTFYIQQRLLKRRAKVMYSYFIEAIFHFNSYEGHESYNKMIVSERERKLFSLSGKKHKAERMKLYRFMLEHMSDEHRFQTTYKLCQDILGGCVEGTVKLTGHSSYELLQDTLACLACEEIKLASLKSKQEEEIDPNLDPSAAGGDVAGAVLAAAKKTIISQVVKKNVIENIIPIVIALKHKLEEAKSPLIDDLMNYLRELMKDYKTEVKEILSEDKQLAAEIQFDLKKWEEEMEARKQKEQEERGHAENDESNEEDQQQLLRAVLETAVKAMKKKKKTQEGEEDNPQEATSETNSQDVNLFQKFLELNLPPNTSKNHNRRHSTATSDGGGNVVDQDDSGSHSVDSVVPENIQEEEANGDQKDNDNDDDDEPRILDTISTLSPKVVIKRLDGDKSAHKKNKTSGQEKSPESEKNVRRTLMEPGDDDDDHDDGEQDPVPLEEESKMDQDSLVMEVNSVVTKQSPGKSPVQEKQKEPLPEEKSMTDKDVVVEGLNEQDMDTQETEKEFEESKGSVESPERMTTEETRPEEEMVQKNNKRKGKRTKGSEDDVHKAKKRKATEERPEQGQQEEPGQVQREAEQVQRQPQQVQQDDAKVLEKVRRRKGKKPEQVEQEPDHIEQEPEQVQQEPEQALRKTPKVPEKVSRRKGKQPEQVEQEPEHIEQEPEHVQQEPEQAQHKTPKVPENVRRKIGKQPEQEPEHVEQEPEQSQQEQPEQAQQELEQESEQVQQEPELEAPKVPEKVRGRRGKQPEKEKGDISTEEPASKTESQEGGKKTKPRKQQKPAKDDENVEETTRGKNKKVAEEKELVEDEETPQIEKKRKTGRNESQVELDKSSQNEGRPRRQRGRRSTVESSSANNKQEEDVEKVTEKPSRGKRRLTNEDEVHTVINESSSSLKAPSTVVEPPPRKAKKKFVLRAISTPNRRELMDNNVTFMEKSAADLSAIPVISPPTVRKRKRLEAKAKVVQDKSDCSFQFRRGSGKDLFEALLKDKESVAAKKKDNDSSIDETFNKRSSRVRKRNPKYNND